MKCIVWIDREISQSHKFEPLDAKRPHVMQDLKARKLENTSSIDEDGNGASVTSQRLDNFRLIKHHIHEYLETIEFEV